MHNLTKLKIFANFSYSRLTQNRFLKNRPRLRNPIWFLNKERAVSDEYLINYIVLFIFSTDFSYNHFSLIFQVEDDKITSGNKKFIQEIVEEKFGKLVEKKGVLTYENSSSLLKTETLPQVEWRKGLKRTGLIGRKLGHYPLWLKNGKRIDTTVIQIVDNHVIKYIPPGEFQPSLRIHLKDYSKSGCLMIGSESIDPNIVTANYAGLFKGSGVMPKRNLSRFIISPQAAILPGTELNVTHFRVGDHVDVRGKT